MQFDGNKLIDLGSSQGEDFSLVDDMIQKRRDFEELYMAELWDKYQRKFVAGQITSLTFLELEIRIMEVMLYAQNLPEPMRKKLVMEQYRRYKQNNYLCT